MFIDQHFFVLRNKTYHRVEQLHDLLFNEYVKNKTPKSPENYGVFKSEMTVEEKDARDKFCEEIRNRKK